MSNHDQDTQEKDRSFSPFYEKAIPVAIFVIVAVIAGVLILAFGIALGLIQPGSPPF